MFLTHRKHIASKIRAQYVNDICSFVAIIYEYNYHNCGQYPSSCLYLKQPKDYARTSPKTRYVSAKNPKGKREL
jgi:hypothetical protein